MTREFSIVPAGVFSLQEAGRFGFGHLVDPEWDGVLRLAFCLDGHGWQVGVEVRQEPAGRVVGTVHGDGDLATVRRQVARILSLDHDGTGFAEVGARDPVIGRLQAAAPGLRPVLFHSPYEAAVWAVLANRRPARQAAEVRRTLAERHGATFELAGVEVPALPAPEQLLGVTELPGLTEPKVAWLHGIARAALAGELDVPAIQAAEPAAAMKALRAIKGLGPFYSSLIVIRAAGLADVLPVGEPRLRALVTELYRLPGPPTDAQFYALAERWRPYRTWASVLVRAAAHRAHPPARAA